MQQVECSAAHTEAIREILNREISTGTALWHDEPRSSEDVASWFGDKQRAGLPVLGLIDGAGELVAFASYGRFRPFAGYRYSVEHSLYVHERHRRRGHGRRLLHAVIERARSEGYATLIGAIATDNAASVALHERLGFASCGTIRRAGFKFGRFIDLSFYQLLLRDGAEDAAGAATGSNGSR